jgi:hypothetical protein
MMGIASRIKALFAKHAVESASVPTLPSSELPAVRRMNEIVAKASETRASRLREVARSRH